MPTLLEFWAFLQTPERVLLRNLRSDAKGGVLSEGCDDVQESRGAWHAKLREFKAIPLAKRRTVGPATSAGQSRCRRLHDHRLRMMIDHLMYRKEELEQLYLERRVVNTPAARRIHQTAVGTYTAQTHHTSIPTVVVSLIIHDKMYILMYLYMYSCI